MIMFLNLHDGTDIDLKSGKGSYYQVGKPIAITLKLDGVTSPYEVFKKIPFIKKAKNVELSVLIDMQSFIIYKKYSIIH